MDDCTVAFCSRMELFPKSAVAQCGLRGFSEALEGVSGGSEPHSVTGSKPD